MVAQLALSDVSGLSFVDLAEREILRPLGMSRSAFAMPPSPAIRADMAYGSAYGAPIPGNYGVCPQLAPAGFTYTFCSSLLMTRLKIGPVLLGRP